MGDRSKESEYIKPSRTDCPSGLVGEPEKSSCEVDSSVWDTIEAQEQSEFLSWLDGEDQAGTIEDEDFIFKPPRDKGQASRSGWPMQAKTSLKASLVEQKRKESIHAKEYPIHPISTSVNSEKFVQRSQGSNDRITSWRESIEICFPILAHDQVSTGTLERTKLDLPSQVMLRRDLEALYSSIFSSSTYKHNLRSADPVRCNDGTIDVIDAAEKLFTCLYKSLGEPYRQGQVNTFGPLLLLAEADPSQRDVWIILYAMAKYFLPGPSHKLRNVIVSNRRSLLPWLLLYHAPKLGVYLSQRVTTWFTADERGNFIISETWIASLFEDKKLDDLNTLIKVWDTCLGVNASLRGSHECESVDPSSIVCYITIYLMVVSERELVRMSQQELQFRLPQVLYEALGRSTSSDLCIGVQDIITSTPSSFHQKLGKVLSKTKRYNSSDEVEDQRTKRDERAKSLENVQATDTPASILSAPRRLSLNLLSVPGKLTQLAPTISTFAFGQEIHLHSQDTIGDNLIVKTANSYPELHSIVLSLPPEDILPAIFSTYSDFNHSSTKGLIQYMILDCRSDEKGFVGSIPTAFKISPQVLFDDDEIEATLSTLSLLKQDYHLCVMGHGYEFKSKCQISKGKSASLKPSSAALYGMTCAEYDAAVAKDYSCINDIVQLLIKHGLAHVSTLEGGYAAAHDFLLSATDFSTDELVDHDSSDCSLCCHQRPESLRISSHSSELLANTKANNYNDSIDSKLDANKDEDMTATKTTNVKPGSSFSKFTERWRATSISMPLPSTESLVEAKNWVTRNSFTPKTSQQNTPSISSNAKAVGQEGVDVSSPIARFRNSFVAMGSEGVDILRKAEYIGLEKALQGMHLASDTLSHLRYHTEEPKPRSQSMPTSASPTHEQFTIDGEDDDPEVANLYDSNSARNSNVSSLAVDPLQASMLFKLNTTVEEVDITPGQIYQLTKGVYVRRSNLQKLRPSLFYISYKKKVVRLPSDATRPTCIKMVQRRLVAVENCLLVLQVTNDDEDLFEVKSCHPLSHLDRMTQMKKNALVVKLYFKWDLPNGECREVCKTYEVQQRDQFIRVVQAAMERQVTTAG